jgi:hypothetical protein
MPPLLLEGGMQRIKDHPRRSHLLHTFLSGKEEVPGIELYRPGANPREGVKENHVSRKIGNLAHVYQPTQEYASSSIKIVSAYMS